MSDVDRRYEAIRDIHYEYDVPLAKLAEVAGVSRQAVSKGFRNRGWQVRKGASAKQKVLRVANTVRRLNAEYLVPYSEIAKLLAVSGNTVSRVMRAGGHKSQGQGSPIPKRKQELIAKLYDLGATQKELADLTGYTQTGIGKAVRRARPGSAGK